MALGADLLLHFELHQVMEHAAEGFTQEGGVELQGELAQLLKQCYRGGGHLVSPFVCL